jgi:hypothetical protein
MEISIACSVCKSTSRHEHTLVTELERHLTLKMICDTNEETKCDKGPTPPSLSQLQVHLLVMTEDPETIKPSMVKTDLSHVTLEPDGAPDAAGQ